MSQVDAATVIAPAPMTPFDFPDENRDRTTTTMRLARGQALNLADWLQYFAHMLALVLLVGLGVGCEDYIAFRCADPDATPVVGRDDAGQLVYDGCVVDGEDGSADETGQ
jgi:hypothetical protein